MSDPLVIEQPPSGPAGRLRAGLKGRWIPIAGAVAVVELILFILVWPGTFIFALIVGAILVLALMSAFRSPAGLTRDMLFIVALAQVPLFAVPVIIGLSVVLAVVAVIAVIVVLAVVLTSRFGRR